RYIDEFCYRINRSQMKNNIFNNIIARMVAADEIYQSRLICS
ncbi:MAG TPA: IS1595 family transposase, partial [Prolixibacteraceae bacterium]|nr:IS1595 family transposase [Prolixibacteraceae bacterium]